jgi:hypothetical protein
MENFLLLFDELDDAVRSFRVLWPQILGFVFALMLFTATILVIMEWPGWALVTTIGVVLTYALASLRPVLGLRTDP